MTNPIEEFFKSLAKDTRYPPNSRYQGVETGTLTSAEGKTIVFLKRRFAPPPERLALLEEHIVAEGDRLDNLAANYLGDPEFYWRIADANCAMSPDELTDLADRRLRITLPEGVPGSSNG
jgi:hypothetical protein